MYYVTSDGLKTAVILRDPDPMNPRDKTYQDNLGTMVCWHRRYNLGDQHDYNEPSDFAAELVLDHVSITDVLTAIKSGELSLFRVTGGENPDEAYTVEVDVSPLSGQNRWKTLDWKISQDMTLIEGESTFDLEDDVLDYCGTYELMKLCNKYGDVAILPLYLYDHSGITMSTGSLQGRAPHAEWDSGQVGYIYIDKDTAMQQLAMPADTLHIARVWDLAERQPITFSRKKGDAWLGFDEIMKDHGFTPVKPEHVRNLYDPAIRGDFEPLIDEVKLKMGGVFKKNHTLYVYNGDVDKETFEMQPVATFNPDLQRLTDENWKSRALEILEGEVIDYDNYLTGEVYGYQLYEGWEEVASCWGFNPGKEDVRDLMKDKLGLPSNTEFESHYEDDFDIDEYLDENDFPELRNSIREKVSEFLNDQEAFCKVPPYGVSIADIRQNKDGILDTVVDALYHEHKIPDREEIHEALNETAGISREAMPKITRDELEPDREYTEEELVSIVRKKPSLADQIAGANARRDDQHSGQDLPGPKQER